MKLLISHKNYFVLESILCGWLLFSALNCFGERALIEYFFQPGCGECEEVNALVLPQLAERFHDRYELKRYDTGVRENYLKLVAGQERLGIERNDPVAMIVNGTIYLGGVREIEKELFRKLETAGPPNSDSSASIDFSVVRRHAETFTLGAVVVAGLVDGINPCVFTTLIFFLSLLAISRVGGFKLLLAGSCYCLACFFTYLGMGFGLFRFVKLFSSYHILQQGLEFALLLLLGGGAFLSFRDAFRFRKSGDIGRVTLQLPDRIKRRIRKIMRNNLGYRCLLPGMFVTGVLVTVLESVCTGQIYLPTLILMAKESGTKNRWIWYLLLYNTMFLLPLLFLFFASWWGVTTHIFLRWSRNNVIYGKIAIGCFFLLLSALLIILM